MAEKGGWQRGQSGLPPWHGAHVERKSCSPLSCVGAVRQDDEFAVNPISGAIFLAETGTRNVQSPSRATLFGLLGSVGGIFDVGVVMSNFKMLSKSQVLAWSRHLPGSDSCFRAAVVAITCGLGIWGEKTSRDALAGRVQSACNFSQVAVPALFTWLKRAMFLTNMSESKRRGTLTSRSPRRTTRPWRTT